MNKTFTKVTLKRALKTFIQAAVSYLAVNLVAVDFNSSDEVFRSALVGIGVSALAAGLAAVMNLETKYPNENAVENESEVE